MFNKKISILLLSLCGSVNCIFSQFAPGVGITGTTAMYKDSSAFVAWANSGIVVRGPQDISNLSLGYTNVGDSSSAFGIAGTSGVVSLGDGGYAILQFANPIIDLPGPDLAVFENSFNDTFLELAFVEVSSDGIHFFRFPATSLTDTVTQTNGFGSTDPTKINNLAGKYRANYGTPFDLEDITDDPLLNKQAITHVKVIDVVGCLQDQYCTRDASNRKINDPWSTPFGSSGFDLDAVGVIHQNNTTSTKELQFAQINLYPNPTNGVLNITLLNSSNISNEQLVIRITDIIGKEIVVCEYNKSIDVSTLETGTYFIELVSPNTNERLIKNIVIYH